MDIVSLTEGLAQLPMPYLAVGATVLLLATAVVLRVLSNTLTFKAPPVMEGIPFVGGLIKFSKVRGGPMTGWVACGSRLAARRRRRSMRKPPPTLLQGPLKLMTEGYEKHGEVFTVPVAHKRITFVLGPHASPHFFNATDDKMSQTEVWRR